MKLSKMAVTAAVLTVAAGATSQAAEQSVAPETTASVPAITVHADGELQYSSEFQRIADNDRGAVDDETILTQTACCKVEKGASGCGCSCSAGNKKS